jgi:hypothetical protein
MVLFSIWIQNVVGKDKTYFLKFEINNENTMLKEILLIFFFLYTITYKQSFPFGGVLKLLFTVTNMVLMVCDPVEILCSFQFNVTSFIFD